METFQPISLKKQPTPHPIKKTPKMAGAVVAKSDGALFVTVNMGITMVLKRG